MIARKTLVMPKTVAAPTVRRSRLRSTTVEPPRVELMPPPNMSERPPPRPACSRMNRQRVSDAITWMTISSGIIDLVLCRRVDGASVSAGVPGRALDDQRELVGVEAGAADQRAVDVRLGGQLLGVGGLDAAAVLDAQLVGGGAAHQLGDGAADQRDRLLGVLGGGGPAGADRPHRLVGDHQPGDLLGGQAGERAAHLALDDLGGLPGLALLEGPADADDRPHAGPEDRACLAVDQLVALAE